MSDIGTMEIEEFYMGLLLALSEKRRGMTTHGDRYQEACVRAIRKARDLAIPCDDLRWPNALECGEALVLFGMSAMLLTLDSPSMIYARLRWSPASATSELDKCPHGSSFRAVAAAFLGGSDVG